MKVQSMLARGAAAANCRSAKRTAEVGAAVLALGAVAVVGAHAGTDTTFAATTTQLTSWTTGSMGKLAAVAAVGFGLFGAIARFDWKLIAGGVGIGLAAATGPGIASALLSAPF